MLATMGAAVPIGRAWTFEPKYDGVRVIAVADPGGAALVSRNGRDKAHQFPEVARAVHALAVRRRRALALDGEIVARAGRSVGRFQQMQSRINVKSSEDAIRAATAAPATLVAFDLLVDGPDVLLDEPWTERRRRLELLLARGRPGADPGLRLGRTSTNARHLLAEARRQGWEGLIAKRRDAPYAMGQRSPAWLKLKLQHEQEFVVGGYTDPRRSRPYFGALLLGYYEGPTRRATRLIYAGLCGGGFTHTQLKAMYQQLVALRQRTSPFDGPPPRTPEPAHWVEPRLVVQVKFNEWTADAKLRQPIFVGLRDDKAARDVRREPESLQP